jgi:hypothetical protein
MNSDPGIQGKLFRGDVAPLGVVLERVAESPAKPLQ